MTHDRDFFTPDDVDEQVDQLSQHSIRDHLPYNERAGEPSQAEVSLIGELKEYYRFEQQEDSNSLERAWERVSVKLSRDHETTQAITKPLSTLSRTLQERILIVQNHISQTPRRGSFSRGLSLLVAGLVAALLVGSLIAVLNLSRHPSTTGGPDVQATKATHAPTATSTPALVPGKTLYTTPTSPVGFKSISWSPNSKRVASVTDNTEGLQFWDATTGDHLVTVQLPDGPSEGPASVSWSPNSEDVAVATTSHLLIVDGQTGHIISSRVIDMPIASNVTSSGHTRFSSLFASSGATEGYLAIAWSPDGHLIASALSFGSYAEVQIWNPQTGAIDFTAKVDNTDTIGALAWSSDGQYIAADTWNPQETGLIQAASKVVAWNISTHQIVFQHDGSLNSRDATIAWQPGTHNLAFVGVPTAGSDQITTIELWDATTGKLVKQYIGASSGPLAWSPDGTDLAYAGYGGKDALNAVIIMDAATGKPIFVYKEHHQPVGVIAWSPNGKYIVSAEGNNAMNQIVARVWTA